MLRRQFNLAPKFLFPLPPCGIYFPQHAIFYIFINQIAGFDASLQWASRNKIIALGW